eukprot:3725360-Ditylum_brightwellii.AAC.1
MMYEIRPQGMKNQVMATRHVGKRSIHRCYKMYYWDLVNHEDIKTVRAIQVFLFFRVEREVAKQGQRTPNYTMVPLKI